jgi:hypothetical protein
VGERARLVVGDAFGMGEPQRDLAIAIDIREVLGPKR